MTQLERRPQKKMKKDLNKKWKMEYDLNKNENESYWADLTTKTSKTNGFDTIEIDLVFIVFPAYCTIKLNSDKQW